MGAKPVECYKQISAIKEGVIITLYVIICNTKEQTEG